MGASAMPNRSSRIWKWLIGAGLLIATVALVLFYISFRLGPGLRVRVIEIVRQKYQSDVELKSLELSLFPRVLATGEGLVLRHHGRTDIPPLVSIGKFSFEASISELVSGPKRVHKLRLEGLRIHVPPKGERPKTKGSGGKVPEFVIDEVIADGAILQILPKKEGKDPLEFELHRLALHSAGTNQPMTYKTSMRNAKPPGLIEATGKFGPWQSDEPSQTAVSGDYTFENADLSVFKGISGILSSVGKFDGVLGRIEAEGVTDTPDFTLTVSGNPVRLKTEYKAVIDGSDGDTYLQPVNAQLLNSSIAARGSVTGKKGVKGKTISLDVDISPARIQDLLRLVMKSDTAFMTGLLSSRAKLFIPPGDVDVVEKLSLSGQFHVKNGKFKNVSVQQKVETLSRRARGDTGDDAAGEDIVHDLKGKFKLSGGVMEFSSLSFGVPGAFIQLAGTYGLRSEELDFHGTARMEAKLSQMTTGFKSLLLKVADPFFKKEGAGAVLPIKITGTREQPSFGLELRRKKPDQKTPVGSAVTPSRTAKS